MEQGRYYRVPAWPCYYRSKDAILGAPGLTTIYRDGEIHCISITNYMNTIISLYIYIYDTYLRATMSSCFALNGLPSFAQVFCDAPFELPNAGVAELGEGGGIFEVLA